jgi:hypothetical protein
VWLRVVAVVSRFAISRDEAVMSRYIRYPRTNRLREAVFSERRGGVSSSLAVIRRRLFADVSLRYFLVRSSY